LVTLHHQQKTEESANTHQQSELSERVRETFKVTQLRREREGETEPKRHTRAITMTTCRQYFKLKKTHAPEDGKHSERGKLK